MSQLGQFCSAGTNLPAPTAAHIKTENGYNDCMLALDYAQNKVSRTLFDFHLSLLIKWRILSQPGKTGSGKKKFSNFSYWASSTP